MSGSFFGVLGVTIPIFLLVGLGMVLRKTKFLPQEAESPLMRVIVTIFYPALILTSVAPAPAVANTGLVVVSILTGFLTIILGFVVCWWVAPLFRLQKGKGRRAFSFTAGIYNYGYLPVPLVLAFYGQHDGTLAILFVHNVGVDLAFWTVGVLILQGVFNREGFRKIVNPPTIALGLALLLNYTGLYRAMPLVLVEFLEYLAAISVPLGIILAGCAIGGLLTADAFRTGWNVVFGACFLRLLLLPLLFLAAIWLIPMPAELKRVVAIQAAMPAGLFPVVVTGFYGGRQDVAVRVVVSTMLVSVLTTPLWIQFIVNWTNLAE